MKANNWYVITGAPHSGKTTLIEKLKELGYKVVLETARVYIDQEIEKGRRIEEIRKNELDFQKKILDLKIENEKKELKDETIFWDRGIPDTWAYLEMIGEALDKSLAKSQYKKVFLLNPLPYEKDYARTENEEEQLILHELLKKAYKQEGHDVVEVKIDGKEERLKFILDNL